MKKTISTISMFLLFVVFAFAQQTAVVVDYNQNSKGTSVNVPQDQILIVRVVEKPSNGASWRVIDMDGSILEQDPQYNFSSFNEGVGSEGFREIRFLAKKKGVTNLKLVLDRPWEKSKAMEEVIYSVSTEGAYTGSIRFNHDEYQAPVLKREDYEVKALPSYYSLKDDGKMSSVKNQGSCGSCWAFAACGVFENSIIMEDNVERNLSEQWMVNCGGNYGFNGCSGGWCPFDMYNEGAVYETDAPYTASDGSCGTYPHHEEISSWTYISGSNSTPSVTAMKQAIYDHGAIWVAIASNGMSNYSSGIWYGTGTTSVDHAVVLCGWDDNDQCWILRNSWGSSWGESGYMRIRYGANAVGYAAAYLVYNGSGNDDTQAPTAPSNLSSSNITASSASLTWTASTDNVGVTGYNIYKNGTLYTNVSGTSANVTGLSANTSYSFYVKAYDAADNLSSASSTIQVTTLDNGGDDTQAPTAPSNLSSSNITASGASLSWTASTDNVGVTGYNIYKDGSLLKNVTGTSANITGLSANTAYSFYVKAFDAAGNISNASNTVSVTTLDDTPSSYCASKGSNSSYFWISSVELNNMVNTSGNNGGYADYTNKTANLMPGSNYTLYLRSTYSYYIYTVYWSIWIDYNQNGVFESSERVLSGPTATTNNVSGIITIPSTALNGSTRMRVSMKYGSLATSCETFSYGEVEDYTVNIGAGQYNSLTANNSESVELGYIEDVCRVYPSPANETLHVNVNAVPESNINIISVDGKLMRTIKATGNEMDINVSGLAPGLYLLQYNNDLGEINAERFMKQ